MESTVVKASSAPLNVVIGDFIEMDDSAVGKEGTSVQKRVYKVFGFAERGDLLASYVLPGNATEHGAVLFADKLRERLQNGSAKIIRKTKSVIAPVHAGHGSDQSI